MSGVRCQKSDVRCQKSEVRDQGSEKTFHRNDGFLYSREATKKRQAPFSKGVSAEPTGVCWAPAKGERGFVQARQIEIRSRNP
ncbi:MAG: hypothetical protein FWC38_01235 [Proteobacteria bacterium]|nr:hypothetical protein [Pseudomonadota bacterium]